MYQSETWITQSLPVQHSPGAKLKRDSGVTYPLQLKYNHLQFLHFLAQSNTTPPSPPALCGITYSDVQAQNNYRLELSKLSCYCWLCSCPAFLVLKSKRSQTFIAWCNLKTSVPKSCLSMVSPLYDISSSQYQLKAKQLGEWNTSMLTYF